MHLFPENVFVGSDDQIPGNFYNKPTNIIYFI